MNAFQVFALVVVLITLVLVGFAIANFVYYQNLKSGVALTSSQVTGLTVINAIGLILSSRSFSTQ